MSQWTGNAPGLFDRKSDSRGNSLSRVDPSTVAGMRSAISEAKFGKYLSTYHGDEKLALRLYAWNTEISGAFWGPISILEVMLRNYMHDTMKHGRSDDWWNSVRLAEKEERSLEAAFDKLKRDGSSNPTPDQVVGATSLGFWVGLTGPGRARDPYLDYETAIWQPRLQGAFPGIGGIGRKQLHDELQRIRAFRNRIAHHEAIFNAPHKQLRELILDVASYVDAGVSDFIHATDRIHEVLLRKQTAITNGDCSI